MISKKAFYILYNRNSPDNKDRNVGSIDARLLLRDLSLPVAYFCAKKGISANTVTFFFLIVSLLGNVLFAMSSIPLTIGAILLFEFAQLLDCVDGQLARYNGSFSYLGHIFDNFCHTILSGTFMLAFGVRIFLETQQYIYLVLGGLAALSFVFCNLWDEVPELRDIPMHKNQTPYYKTFMKYVYTVTDELRFYTVLILAVSVVDAYTHQLGILKSIFVLHVLFIVYDKVIKRFNVVLAKSSPNKSTVWKGWK